MSAVMAVRYVAGFLFDPNREFVVLVRKNRPQWQEGKLNGVGGHIEDGESGADAMRREFREEAGLDVESWEHFATIGGNGLVHGDRWEVEFYRAESSEWYAIQKMTDEDVRVYEVAKVKYEYCIANLYWLIPMAMPSSRHDWPYQIMEKADV